MHLHFLLRGLVFNLPRVGLIIAALVANNYSLLREGLRDEIHQPARYKLLPGFEEVLRLNEARIPGLFGICLSGAGSAVLAVTEESCDHEQIYLQIQKIFHDKQIETRPRVLEVGAAGRMIL